MPTQEELDFFEEKREGLEMLYDGKFVLIKGRKLIGAYDHQDDVFKEYGLRCTQRVPPRRRGHGRAVL